MASFFEATAEQVVGRHGHVWTVGIDRDSGRPMVLSHNFAPPNGEPYSAALVAHLARHRMFFSDGPFEECDRYGMPKSELYRRVLDAAVADLAATR